MQRDLVARRSDFHGAAPRAICPVIGSLVAIALVAIGTTLVGPAATPSFPFQKGATDAPAVIPVLSHRSR